MTIVRFRIDDALGRYSPWFVHSKWAVSDQERSRIVERAKELFARDSHTAPIIRRPMRILHGFALFLVGGVIVGFASATLVHWVLAMFLLLFLFALLVWAVYWSRRRPYLLQALRAVGDEPCSRCGYQLRSLPREVIYCPECGAVRPCPTDDAPGYMHAGQPPSA